MRDVWEAHATAKRREDFDDLQRELSGTQHTKMKRFTAGTGAACQMSSEEKKKKDDDNWFFLMWLSHITESYRQAYYELEETIRQVREASLLALDDIRKKRKEVERQLEEMRERAIRLNDGKRA